MEQLRYFFEGTSRNPISFVTLCLLQVRAFMRKRRPLQITSEARADAAGGDGSSSSTADAEHTFLTKCTWAVHQGIGLMTPPPSLASIFVPCLPFFLPRLPRTHF
jgi:hypothetical protein